MKRFHLLTIFLLVCASAWAGPTSYIRIVDPEYDESTRYAYNTDSISEVAYVFKGEVSADCVSIRVLWSSGDENNIDEYLANYSKPVKGITVDDFELKKFRPGDRSFIYNASGRLDNLVWGSNYYRFIAKFSDGRLKTYNLTLWVHTGGAAERAKPVIYLYPTKKQNVKVTVSPKGGVTESIPEMGSGWNVTAYPDGKIVDRKSKQEYPYLFWESDDGEVKVNTDSGFVVSTENLESFFKEKLAFLGLNEKEIADFNEYWIPELTSGGKPYVFISFYSQERIDAEAPLKVSPKPDTVIRVYFEHILLDEPIEVQEQVLVKGAQRKGFTVTEWGGLRYKK